MRVRIEHRALRNRDVEVADAARCRTGRGQDPAGDRELEAEVGGVSEPDLEAAPQEQRQLGRPALDVDARDVDVVALAAVKLRGGEVR